MTLAKRIIASSITREWIPAWEILSSNELAVQNALDALAVMADSAVTADALEDESRKVYDEIKYRSDLV